MPRQLSFLSWLRRPRRRPSGRPARPLPRSRPMLEVLEDRLAPSIGFTIPLGDSSAPAALTPPVAFSGMPLTSGIQMSVVSQRTDSSLPSNSLVIYIDPVDFDLQAPTGQRLQSLINQNAANPFYKTDGVNGLLTVPGALGGRYQLQLTGTGSEPFRFSVTYVSSQGQATSYLFQGSLQGLSPLFVLDFDHSDDTRIASTPATHSPSNTPSLPASSGEHRTDSLSATAASSSQATTPLTLADATAAALSNLLLALRSSQPQGSALSSSPSPNLELSTTTAALRVATGLSTANSGGAFSATDFALGALSRVPQAARLTEEAEMSGAQPLEPETLLAGEPRPEPVETRLPRVVEPEPDRLVARAVPLPPSELPSAPPVATPAAESEAAFLSAPDEAVEAPASMPEAFLTRARAVTILLATVLAGGLQHTLVDRRARNAPALPARKPRESSRS